MVGDAGLADVVDYTKIKYPMEIPDYDAVPTYPPRPHFNKKHFGESCRTVCSSPVANCSAGMQISTQLVVFDGCPNDPYHPAR